MPSRGKNKNKAASNSPTPAPSAAPTKRRNRPKKHKNQPIKARDARTVGNTVVAEWQRLPAQLLREYCQKQKRPRPQFFTKLKKDPESKDENSDRMFTCNLFMPDPKNDKNSLRFYTKECFATRVESEHMASLLALKHLEPDRPLERVLPEPFKSAWRSLQSDSPTVSSSSKFVTKTSRVTSDLNRRKRANLREMRADQHLAKVIMSEENRDFIDYIIRSIPLESAAPAARQKGADVEVARSVVR
eukprot:708121_1